MKKAKDNVQVKPSIYKKPGKLLNEILPSTVKNIPREQLPLKLPETVNREYEPFMEPSWIPEEWPGDEEAKVSYKK
jgi:hypothetical protein